MRELPRLLVLLIASACGSSSPPPAEPPPAQEDKPAAAGDVLQPPFGADDLRRAFVVGLTLRYRITEADKGVRVEEWKVTAADAETCTLHVKVFAEDGTTLTEDQGDGTSEWTELEGHGREGRSEEKPKPHKQRRLQRVFLGHGRFTRSASM